MGCGLKAFRTSFLSVISSSRPLCPKTGRACWSLCAEPARSRSLSVVLSSDVALVLLVVLAYGYYLPRHPRSAALFEQENKLDDYYIAKVAHIMQVCADDEIARHAFSNQPGVMKYVSGQYLSPPLPHPPGTSCVSRDVVAGVPWASRLRKEHSLTCALVVGKDVGLAVVGIDVGLAVVGLMVVGLAVVGLAVVGLAVGFCENYRKR